MRLQVYMPFGNESVLLLVYGMDSNLGLSMLNDGVTFIRFSHLLVNILNSYTEKTCISSSYLFGLFTPLTLFTRSLHLNNFFFLEKTYLIPSTSIPINIFHLLGNTKSGMHLGYEQFLCYIYQHPIPIQTSHILN